MFRLDIIFVQFDGFHMECFKFLFVFSNRRDCFFFSLFYWMMEYILLAVFSFAAQVFLRENRCRICACEVFPSFYVLGICFATQCG